MSLEDFSLAYKYLNEFVKNPGLCSNCKRRPATGFMVKNGHIYTYCTECEE